MPGVCGFLQDGGHPCMARQCPSQLMAAQKPSLLASLTLWSPSPTRVLLLRPSSQENETERSEAKAGAVIWSRNGRARSSSRLHTRPERPARLPPGRPAAGFPGRFRRAAQLGRARALRTARRAVLAGAAGRGLRTAQSEASRPLLSWPEVRCAGPARHPPGPVT